MPPIAIASLLILFLACVLLLSAVMKWRDHAGSLRAVREFGIPAPLVPAATAVLPVVEATLGVLLTITAGVAFCVVVWITVTVFLGFTATVVVSLLRGRTPECHCFGELSAEPISAVTVLRNGAFTLAALVLAVSSPKPWPGLTPGILQLNTDTATLLAVICALAGCVVGLWAGQKRVHLELSRHAARNEELSTQIARLKLHVAQTPQSLTGPPDLERIPPLQLQTSTGDILQLAELSGRRAILLLVVRPGCGQCAVAMAALPAWSEVISAAVSIQVLSLGTTTETLTHYPDNASEALYARDDEVQKLLGIAHTPAALLLGTAGQVGAGPVGGVEAIQELVDGISTAINQNSHTAQGSSTLHAESR